MLSQPKLITVQSDRPTPKYHVYYDEWTGEIKNVTSKLKKSEYLNFVTDDNAAAEIMMGILNPKNFLAIETPDGMSIVHKDSALKIKKAEDQLSKVKVVPTTIDSDINIIFYLDSWKLEVNINQDTLYKLTGRRFNKKFSKADNTENTELDLYLIKHSNPLILVDTIKIDPIELINNGFMIFDMSHLVTKVGLGDIDVLTRRIFKSYGLKIKQNYVTTDYHTRKSHRRVHADINKNTKSWSTFNISPSTEGWIIKSNFDDPHEQKIYKDLVIFLTGNNPNELKDKINIPYEKMGQKQEFLVKTKVDPTTCKLLLGEEGRNITFKYEEIEYVKPGKY
jgi:hypothetical protein